MGRLKRAHNRLIRKHIKEQAHRNVRRIAIQTGTAAMFVFSGGIPLQQKALAAGDSDPHHLCVSPDRDGDLLADWEERVLGYDPANPDEDRNGISDGVGLAARCAEVIRSIPVLKPGDPVPEGLHATELLAFGLEQCDVCGESFNMGALIIHTPDVEIALPFIAVHFLEHGSFSHSGTVHKDRINVPELVRILGVQVPNPGNHQVTVPNDADNDQLSDEEEYSLGYSPFDNDQNRNLTADGADLSRCIAARVNELIASAPTPGYEIFRHELDGLEQCHICGRHIHMGGTNIVNTRLGLKYPNGEGGFLPDLALHAMEHGAFDYFGTQHIGRVDTNLLANVLEIRLPHMPDRHELPLKNNDTDRDGLSDSEEIAARLNMNDPDQNQNLIPDGVDLAMQCKRVLDSLPVYETPQPGLDRPYKINCFMRGLEQCEICGQNVNMGYWEVHNPRLNLSLNIPDIVVHYLQHGSFEYSGSVHGRGRIDVVTLLRILNIPTECGDLGTIYRPADLNKDCVVNLQDLAEMAWQWLADTHP